MSSTDCRFNTKISYPTNIIWTHSMSVRVRSLPPTHEWFDSSKNSRRCTSTLGVFPYYQLFEEKCPMFMFYKLKGMEQI